MNHGSSPAGPADIVIAVRNQYSRTRVLLECIYRFSDRPFHIYLIDDGSTDGTADLEKVYARDITVVHNRQDRGWSACLDQGVSLGNAPYVVVVNHEAEVAQGWLGNLLSFLDTHPRIGAVGPLTSCPSDWQSVDRVRENLVPEIPQFLTEDQHERSRILSYHFNRAGILVDGVLSLFCVALKRRVIDEVGPFHDSAGADEDYCRRIRRARFVIGLALDTYVVRRTTAACAADPGDERRHETGRHSHSRLRERDASHFTTSRR